MIAQPSASADTMLDALGYTMGALDAARDLDIDRNQSDRPFFDQEHAALMPHFEAVEMAERALMRHERIEHQRLQARVVIGDAVLDQGVRAAKQRAKLGLRGKEPGDPELVFPADIRDITDAERQVEPQLVVDLVARFPLVADFEGKAELASDLTGRATRQKTCFQDRDAGATQQQVLDGKLRQAIHAASDALYGLEKRLLDRFKRQRSYVRGFFLDVGPPRRRPAALSPADPSGTPT